jgi:hypothetical protein
VFNINQAQAPHHHRHCYDDKKTGYQRYSYNIDTMLNSSMHTKNVIVLTIHVCILLITATTTSALILGYQIAEAAAEQQQQQQEKFFMVMKLQKNSDSYYQVSNMTTNMKNFNQGNNKVEYILEMSPCS